MKTRFSFGLKMAALKWARQLLKKEQAEIESRKEPITPLDSHIQKQLTIPMEATAPVKETSVVINMPSPLERALNHLREQAKL
jgi:hypothetical protein